MNDIDSIKERIKMRKNRPLNDQHFHKIYNFMIKIMVLLVLIIGLGSYIKISPNHDIILESINELSSLTHLKDFINQMIITDSEEVTVSNEVFYTHLEDNYYTNSTNESTCLMEGTVIETGTHPIMGNYIVVLNDDLKVTYGCMEEVFVGMYDFVDESMVLGTYNDKLMLVFSKGDSEIDYSTFEELIK